VRIETAWASLFYPPPDDCAKETIHAYLREPLRQKALDFLSTISLGQREIQDLLNLHHDLQQRADELGRKISRLEGIDHDGTLSSLKNQLEDIQNRMDSLAEHIRVDDRKLNALKRKCHHSVPNMNERKENWTTPVLYDQ
jgi:DNA sulfur modification protein DndD